MTIEIRPDEPTTTELEVEQKFERDLPPEGDDYYDTPGTDAKRYKPDGSLKEGGGHSKKKQCCTTY